MMSSSELLLHWIHHYIGVPVIQTYGYSVSQLPLHQRLVGLVHTVEQQLTTPVIALFTTILHQHLQANSNLLHP